MHNSYLETESSVNIDQMADVNSNGRLKSNLAIHLFAFGILKRCFLFNSVATNSNLSGTNASILGNDNIKVELQSEEENSNFVSPDTHESHNLDGTLYIYCYTFISLNGQFIFVSIGGPMVLYFDKSLYMDPKQEVNSQSVENSGIPRDEQQEAATTFDQPIQSVNGKKLWKPKSASKILE